MVSKEQLKSALEKALEDKGKRKFTQSVELILNFRGIDFSKPENRINLDIALPAGKGGKEPKVVVFAEESVGSQAKKAGADDFITPEQIEELAKDRAKLKKLTRESVFLAQPNLIGLVARHLGQFLGPRGKIPKPLVGNMEDTISRVKRSIRITSRGKYLPTAQAFVGTEKMDIDKILENIEFVIDRVKTKIPEGNFKSMYIKLTMGKAVKV